MFGKLTIATLYTTKMGGCLVQIATFFCHNYSMYTVIITARIVGQSWTNDTENANCHIYSTLHRGSGGHRTDVLNERMKDMSETKTDYADYADACREIGLTESTVTALDNRESTENMMCNASNTKPLRSKSRPKSDFLKFVLINDCFD